MPLPERGLVMYEAGRNASRGGSSRPPVIVEALPEIGQYGVTYLVPNGGAPPNIYDEYVWVSPEAGYELLGQKEVDLSRYVRDTRTVNGHPLSANVVVTYADLQDKPSIEGVTLAGDKTAVDLGLVPDVRKVGGVPLLADIPVSLTGDTAITVANTGTASAIGYSITHDDSGVTAGSKGNASNQTPGFGGTFKALSATVDAKGHVTELGDHNVTIPSATATSQANGLMSSSDKAKLDALSVTASNPLEVTKTGETYNVTLKDSGVTAGSKGNASNQTPGFGGTFKTLSASVDAKGRLTALNERNVTIPSEAATTSAAGLMSAADKDKLDNIIDATLSNSGQAADAKATGDAFAALRNYLASMEIYRTASGNPATFDDGAAANVRDLTVTITPTQSGSGDPSPDNIRPISGVSSVSVVRTGKNLLKITANSGTMNGLTFTVNRNSAGNVTSVTVNGAATETTHFALATFPSTDGYEGKILSGCPSGGAYAKFSVYMEQKYSPWYGIAWDFGGDKYAIIGHSAQTVQVVIRVVNGVTMNNAIFYPMITDEFDTTFAPYQGQTVTVSLTDGANPLTVYGGTLDVTTGTLSVTWANIASYAGETLPGRWISDRDVYAPGTSPTTGAQVVYELAEPVIYPLTSAQLAALSGHNAVSSDAGNVSVTYRADTSLTFGGVT